MRKAGKNITKAREAVEKRPYPLQEAVPLLQKVKYAKFDETVEVTMRLGVDPKHADQMVRGTVVLPHGLGKSKKVLVIATGDKIKEAEAAGADFAGGEGQVHQGRDAQLDDGPRHPARLRRCRVGGQGLTQPQAIWLDRYGFRIRPLRRRKFTASS